MDGWFMANLPNSDQTVGPEEDVPRRCMACPVRGEGDDDDDDGDEEAEDVNEDME